MCISELNQNFGEGEVMAVSQVVVGQNEHQETERGDRKKKYTWKELALGVPCFILPVGGIVSAYFFGFSIHGKIAASFLGFLSAFIYSVIVIWWMKKKGKLI